MGDDGDSFFPPVTHLGASRESLRAGAIAYRIYTICFLSPIQQSQYREAHDEEGRAQPLVQAEMMVMEKSLGYGSQGLQFNCPKKGGRMSSQVKRKKVSNCCGWRTRNWEMIRVNSGYSCSYSNLLRRAFPFSSFSFSEVICEWIMGGQIHLSIT